MPYIKQEIRWLMQPRVDTLVFRIRGLPDDERDGALNYVVSKLVHDSMTPETGWRYHSLHRAYGVFLAAAAEFYRRVVAPYEDTAIEKNGDIY